MDRRSFLGMMTAATVMANRVSWAAADHKIGTIAVQLYTVRDAIAKDFDGTLAKVAGVGYTHVELAGFTFDNSEVCYFGKTPQELRDSLDHHGLVAPSTHVNYKSLSPENFPKVLEASHILGHEYIVNPWVDEEVRKQPEGWKSVVETFNRAGAASKKAGFQFAYHNHWFEFLPVDGRLPYDLLLQQCDPQLVKMEMDLCWVTAAGADPVKYFNDYPGRFPLVHVKDLKKIPQITTGGAQNFGDSVDLTAVGSGIIDWKRIFSQAGKAGIKLYIVEHDRPKEPIENIKASYDYLEKLRF
ncbi:MAG: sugar phosphate isomerase/epimerase [Terriglobales bacterium]